MPHIDKKDNIPQFPVIYLARHGETDFNLRKVFQGLTDNPLNETGIRQAEALRETLHDVPLTRVFVSPLKRARTTASIVLNDRDIPEKVESRLIEINFGAWESTPEAEVKERWMEDYMDYRNNMNQFHPEGGESARDAQKRAGEWWEEISEKHAASGEHILVVAHQSLNAVLACHICGIPLEQAWENFRTRPGEVIRIVPGRLAQVSRLMPDIEQG